MHRLHHASTIRRVVFARNVFDRLSQAALFCCCVLAWARPSAAGAFEDAEKLYRTGQYDECAKLVDDEMKSNGWNEAWRHLQIKNELARGKHAEAITAVEDALRRFPASVTLHLLGYDAYHRSGRDQDATAALDAIDRLFEGSPRRYATAPGLVTLGRYFLIRGADAKKVLDQFYDPVTKQQPNYIDGHLATAELALDKEDFALAADTLRKAPKEATGDPLFHYLLARALADGDRAGSEKALEAALKINPRHIDSLLLHADLLIDGERYAEAEQVLKQVFDVDSGEPRAWAYRAVLAHLKSDNAAEATARQSALDRWASNPDVDHIIGRKLSQKYRFAEGAARQRQALSADPNFMPAKIQLCQDLLRLGDEAEGWKLAAEIFSKDGYNVVAFNLITLRDRLAGFQTLSDEGLIVRMEKREADLYGQRVVSLLKRARSTLCPRYGVTLKEPVIVEIFPQHKEFAVRTFGLPGADGLLGVCFGRVVTANSPASQGEHPANWEAVLWHEFCHVVTLSKTHNKMPRWLSEGISVYEEGREDLAWSTPLNPRFRAMILGESLTPLSKLSSAFLAPKTPLHLQFAYFESALAVEFIIERCGLPALNGLLDDLGAGSSLSDAVPRRTKMSLVQVDADFAQFARQRALKIAPDATWEEPELSADANSSQLKAWLDKHPKSFEGLRRLAARLIKEEEWSKAKYALEQLKQLYPEYVGPDNAYLLLALVYRRLSDSIAERKELEVLATKDGDASPAYLRLMVMDEAAGDWASVAKNARRVLAVNPLIAAPYRPLARAAEKLGERDEAVLAYRALVRLDETDTAGTHYHLARLLRDGGKPAEARREVLRSLEDAPRFREAHQLLLELVESAAPSNPRSQSPSTPKAAVQ
jgi:tetratricopeptide (TPR) repeat protein